MSDGTMELIESSTFEGFESRSGLVHRTSYYVVPYIHSSILCTPQLPSVRGMDHKAGTPTSPSSHILSCSLVEIDRHLILTSASLSAAHALVILDIVFALSQPPWLSHLSYKCG